MRSFRDRVGSVISSVGRRAPMVFLVVALLLVSFRTMRYGKQLPFSDDWDFLRLMVGADRLTVGALFTPYNEHRIPIPLATLFLSFNLFRGDYRWIAVTNTLLLALGAFSLLGAIRSLRGALCWRDIAVPAVLLGFSHHAHGWSFYAQFTLSTVLILLLLGLLLASSRDRHGGRPWTMPAAALLLTLCALCGLQGALPALVMSVWLLMDGWLRWRRAPGREARTAAVLAVASSGTAAVVCAAILLATPTTDASWTAPAVGEALAYAVHVLGSPVGVWAVRRPWMASLVSAVLLGVCALAWIPRRSAPEAAPSSDRVAAGRGARLRRITMVIVAMVALAGSIGIGRAAIGAPLTMHYGVLFTPFFIAVYLLLEVGLPSRWTRTVSSLFALVLTAIFLAHIPHGMKWSRSDHEKEVPVMAKIVTGATMDDLVAEHMEAFYFSDLRESEQARAMVRRGLLLLAMYDVEPFTCFRREFGGPAIPPYCRDE